MREEFEKNAKRRRGRAQQYRVVLTKVERDKLLRIVENPLNEFQRWRAKILIALDEGKLSEGERRSHSQIALECQVSSSSVYRTGKRFADQGLEACINANITGAPIAEGEEQLLRQLIEKFNQKSIAWSARRLAKELGRSTPAVCRALIRLSNSSKEIS